MPAVRRRPLLLALIPLLLVAAVLGGWAVDRARTEGEVGRRVEVAGIELSGMDRAEVAAVAGRLADEAAGAEVVLSTGDELLATTAGDLGATVDGDALADAALDARSGGPLRWLAGFVDTVELAVPYAVDEGAAAAEVSRLAEELPDPTEPTLVVRDGVVEAVPGADGQTLDVDEVVAELPAVLARPAPHVVDVDPVPLPPEADLSTMEAVAAEANETVARPLVVVVEDQEVVVEADELRSWVMADADAPEPAWTLDGDAVAAALRPRFSGLGAPEQQPRFDVVDGRPVIVPAAGLVVCCAADSGDRMAAALQAGEERVALDTRLEPTDDGVAELEALGIVEEVASFTTHHACCEGRVRNIQRFADLVRGMVIPPGGRLSLNEAVGPRTEAKGFVPAGAIVDGVLEPQVGGGVSQFATTFFNAAFFAGLDFVEYQAHSIYFSRYPRGREATISFPKPDLVVENPTPYGILIWPTYTETSITVALYSTRTVEVADLGRTEAKQGECTRVTTTRERRWADGTTERDTVFATYRPAEGLDCSGNPTDRAREPQP